MTKDVSLQSCRSMSMTSRWPVYARFQRVFGELKIEWHSFSNCGVRNVQDQQTKDITLDQIVYVGNLRPIVHAQAQHSKPEDLCCPELHKLYMSLLGAVAYLAHTRLDVVVFICALQRHKFKPQAQHVKKLNKLLTWVKKNPRKLVYRRFCHDSWWKSPDCSPCLSDTS